MYIYGSLMEGDRHFCCFLVTLINIKKEKNEAGEGLTVSSCVMDVPQ